MPGVEGKRILVTGANRGIGFDTANLLASRGAVVCGLARNPLPSERSDSALFDKFIEADVSNENGCHDAVERAVEMLGGPIDVLICNHGIGSAHEIPLQETDNDTFRTSMAINLEGPYYLTRAIMPSMVKQKYGRLVYTSSTAAIDAEYAAVGYNTSKAGLLGLMRSVAQDGGIHNITANAVLPGWVRTEMSEKSALAEAKEKGTTPEKIWEERAALYPPKRVVTPMEVAHTIAFFASEESSGVSGESIRVALGCPW